MLVIAFVIISHPAATIILHHEKIDFILSTWTEWCDDLECDFASLCGIVGWNHGTVCVIGDMYGKMKLLSVIVLVLVALILLHTVLGVKGCEQLWLETYNCYYGDNNYKWCYGRLRASSSYNPAGSEALSYNDPNPALGGNGYTTAYYRSNWEKEISSGLWYRNIEVGRANDGTN